mmetsp:Transcript_5140/g.14491  ORF Transcript_5140/g.14491 Transcript_5140/m.14491 type:complete len:216 (-) Transcript_5140:398-1045(-)
MKRWQSFVLWRSGTSCSSSFEWAKGHIWRRAHRFFMKNLHSFVLWNCSLMCCPLFCCGIMLSIVFTQQRASFEGVAVGMMTGCAVALLCIHSLMLTERPCSWAGVVVPSPRFCKNSHWHREAKIGSMKFMTAQRPACAPSSAGMTKKSYVPRRPHESRSCLKDSDVWRSEMPEICSVVTASETCASAAGGPDPKGIRGSVSGATFEASHQGACQA